MSLIQIFQKELEAESQTTRKMLSRVPADKFDWQPHPKSMTVRQLSSHIAELPSWITMALTTDELDFAKAPYEATPINDTADLLDLFERSLVSGRDSLSNTTEDTLAEPWTLRNGDEIYMKSTKGETVRHALSQTIHHRAQLGVFLRLLNIPIPGSYGPSADEMDFVSLEEPEKVAS